MTFEKSGFVAPSAASDGRRDAKHEIPFVYILAFERINAKCEIVIGEGVVAGGEWTGGQVRYAKRREWNDFNPDVCQSNKFCIPVNSHRLACRCGICRCLFAIGLALLIRQISKCL
jgi:hypothetical protein